MNSEIDVYKYSYYPIQHFNLEKLYIDQRDTVWTPSEISYKEDYDELISLDKKVISTIEIVLSFFAQIDGIINENISENFKHETENIKECKLFYSAQEFIENIHNEVYSNLVQVFIKDEEKKKKTFLAIQNNLVIQKIVTWIMSWTRSNENLLYRIIAVSCVESIIFNIPFTIIYWIKYKYPGKFKGLTKANEWIARDEALHFRFSTELYKVLVEFYGYERCSQEKVQKIIREVITLSEDFINILMEENYPSLSKQELLNYAKNVANNVLESYSFEKIYPKVNCLDWMVTISLPNKTNFFESEVSEYAKISNNIYLFNEETDF